MDNQYIETKIQPQHHLFASDLANHCSWEWAQNLFPVQDLIELPAVFNLQDSSERFETRIWSNEMYPITKYRS